MDDERPVVLCVDDEPDVLAALARVLRSESVDLRTTTDPASALTLLGREPVALVLADQRMPGMTGAELLAAVREVSPASARLMLTAHPDPDVVAACLRQRIQGLLTKPWSVDDLRRTVRTLTAPHDPVAPAPGERCVEIDCAGTSIADVCDAIALGILRPPCRASGAVIVLEHTPQLDGSVGGLFRRLRDLLEDGGVSSLLIDRSGLAVTFWQVAGTSRSVVGAGITGAVLVRGDVDA